VAGRYVYVYLGPNRRLSLCGVQVLGKVLDVPPALTNFARDCMYAGGSRVRDIREWEEGTIQHLDTGPCPARQISTLEPGSADKAVDHRGVSGSYESGHCSHTKAEVGGAWWMVDLQKVVYVDFLLVRGRNDLAARTDNMDVYVSNALEFHKINYETEVCVRGFPALPRDRAAKIKCNQKLAGSRVWIFLESRRTPRILTLCEVEIYGERAPNLARYAEGILRALFCSGEACTHTHTHMMDIHV